MMYKLVAQNTEPFPSLPGGHFSQPNGASPQLRGARPYRMPPPNPAMFSMRQAVFPPQYPLMPRGYGSQVRVIPQPPVFANVMQPVVVCPSEKLAELFPGMHVLQISKIGVTDDRGCFWPWPQGYKPMEVPMTTGISFMPVHPSMGLSTYQPPFQPYDHPRHFNGHVAYGQLFQRPQHMSFPQAPQPQQVPPPAQNQFTLPSSAEQTGPWPAFTGPSPSGSFSQRMLAKGKPVPEPLTDPASTAPSLEGSSTQAAVGSEVAGPRRLSSTGSQGESVRRMVEALLASPIIEGGDSGGDDGSVFE